MTKEKKIVSKSLLKQACIKNKESTISSAGVDSQKVFEEIDELIDEGNEQIGKQIQRKVINKKNRKHKFLALTFTIAACSVICALLVTGGIVSSIEPMMKNTNPGMQANSLEQDQNKSINEPTPRENTIVVTEEAIDYYKENEISNGDKGRIVLSGGEDKTNYTNPMQAVLKKKDLNTNECQWNIKRYRDNTTIYNGTGTMVKSHLKNMIEKNEDGKYVITYIYKDKYGNSFTSHSGFEIVTKDYNL